MALVTKIGTETPATMKQWQFDKSTTDPSTVSSLAKLVENVPVPTIKAGEILVKVSRATINPNDLIHLRGTYFATKHHTFPKRMGFEGSGLVVASQGPWYLPSSKVGTRVAFYAADGGAFGEYVVVDANSAIPIPEGASYEDGAMAMVNPLTAIAMVDKVNKPFINTAAASALGKMILHYANTRGIDVICIVRRDSQVKELRELGAKYVYNSSDPDFETQLKTAVEETKCHWAYDCVCGTMPETLLKVLPNNSVVSLYGDLSGVPVTIQNLSTWTFGKRLEGFFVSEYMESLYFWSLLSLIGKISKGMGKEYKANLQKTFPLEELPAAYAFYNDHMSGGKVQIITDETL